MREIKFRAWDKEFKMVSKPMEVFKNGQSFFFFQGIGTRCPNYESLIIVQFTGLKDKNGKEIYEGDKILDSNNVVWIVSFGAGSFVATMMGGSDCDSLYSVIDKAVEVIGNIYQEEATP